MQWPKMLLAGWHYLQLIPNELQNNKTEFQPLGGATVRVLFHLFRLEGFRGDVYQAIILSQPQLNLNSG